jgi:predicted alpha/beta superfamily hydrolase
MLSRARALLLSISCALGAVAFALSFSATVPRAIAGAIEEPNLVQPESLPQGFILVVEDKSKLASADSPIFLAASLNNWNPADPKFRLTGRSDMRWQIALPQPVGIDTLEFKFTRGSWDLEELDSKLTPIANRTLPKIDISALKPGEQPTIELSVVHWGDEKAEVKQKTSAKGAYRELHVTGNVKRLQLVGGGVAPNGANLYRDALVWLPPGYDDAANANVSYPVLYLMDGQNVFEQPPGVPGEWHADEIATDLITSGKVQPFIIVAIPHAGPARFQEYLPAVGVKENMPGADHPGGDAFVDWLLAYTTPRVERAFRVKSGPENTFIGGSSMGAIISLHACVTHPEKFGGLLLESMPFTLGGRQVWDNYLSGVKRWPIKTAIGMGAHELGKEAEKDEKNAVYVEAARALEKRIQTSPDKRDACVRLDIGPDDTHNEAAWARRLPGQLEFLFAK